MEEGLDPSFSKSYHRILKKVQDDMTFAESFYKKLLAVDPKYIEMFDETDFKIQHSMIIVALLQFYTYSITEQSDESLKRIGYVHGRFNLNAEDFEIWKACMMETVREYDDQFDEINEQKWESIIDISIEYIKKGIESYKTQSALDDN